MTAARVLAVAALLVSVACGLTAWSWRTGAVGGSDSACYALMASAYAAGQRQPESALARRAPWPDATRVAAPGGFLPSASGNGAAVPVCAPGYGLLVAPLVLAAGRQAVHGVPAVTAALVVWLAFVLARRLAGPWAGLGAAVLAAVSPIVLFQAVQPMNDITTGALWLGVAAATVTGRPLVAGLLVGVGLLVRPNLAPAAVTAVLACGALAAGAADERRLWHAVRTMALASAAALPGVATALALNASLYGSPFRSGYGDLDVLFAWSHVPTNVSFYGRTWLATTTPAALLALATPFVVAPAMRLRGWVLVAFAASLSVVYLAYRPFSEWWYLRFLLPAVVLSIVLAVSALTTLCRRWGGLAASAVGALTLALMATGAWRAPEALDAFRLHRLEVRFPLTSSTVGAKLPASAVLVTGWQSGGVRFDPGNEVVMWDALDPAWLDRAIEWLAAEGRAPAIVLETWEEEGFRARFAGQIYGGLDWPPRYDVDRRVHIFLPEDRARFRAGAVVPTERVFAGRPGAGR
jgi:hypothetical protein